MNYIFFNRLELPLTDSILKHVRVSRSICKQLVFSIVWEVLEHLALRNDIKIIIVIVHVIDYVVKIGTEMFNV